MKILEKIFASKTQVKLLTFLIKNIDKEFYQRQIVQELGESLSTIQYEIKRLSEIGLIDKNTIDRKVYYSINRSFYIFPELRDIIFKTLQRNL